MLGGDADLLVTKAEKLLKLEFLKQANQKRRIADDKQANQKRRIADDKQANQKRRIADDKQRKIKELEDTEANF